MLYRLDELNQSSERERARERMGREKETGGRSTLIVTRFGPITGIMYFGPLETLLPTKVL